MWYIIHMRYLVNLHVYLPLLIRTIFPQIRSSLPLASIVRTATTSTDTPNNVDEPAVSKHYLNIGFHQELPKACYGGRHTVAMITGDGLGPEFMGYVKEVYQLLGAPVDFEEINVNQDCDEITYRDALLAMKRNGVGIKGNFATEPGNISSERLLFGV